MNPLNRKQYRILSLSNGDKVIGEVIEKSQQSITVYRPYSLKVLTMMEEIDDDPSNMMRQEMLILKDWLDLSKTQKAIIEKVHIISITEPEDKVSDFYDTEKEKDDNPEIFKSILDKLKEQKDLDFEDGIFTQEQEFVSNFLDNVINKNTRPEYEFDDVEDDVEEDEEVIEPKNENDTDDEMYGW